MVVEVVEDLDAGVVSPLPVREVALPHLVGQVGLEADETSSWAASALSGNLSVALEDAPDGGTEGASERVSERW